MSDEGRLIFFNGTVMRGQPAHHHLEGAIFLRRMRTSPRYRLYSIEDRHPAMIATSRDDGISVPGELYFVPHEVWPAIEQSEPDGLYCGHVELSGGETVYGMLGRPRLIAERGQDVSDAGGWIDYLERDDPPA